MKSFLHPSASEGSANRNLASVREGGLYPGLPWQLLFFAPASLQWPERTLPPCPPSGIIDDSPENPSDAGCLLKNVAASHGISRLSARLHLGVAQREHFKRRRWRKLLPDLGRAVLRVVLSWMQHLIGQCRFLLFQSEREGLTFLNGSEIESFAGLVGRLASLSMSSTNDFPLCYPRLAES